MKSEFLHCVLQGDGFRVIRAQDGFEVLMLVPGYTLDEMDIRATDGRCCCCVWACDCLTD